MKERAIRKILPNNIGQKSWTFREFCKRSEEIEATRKAGWRRLFFPIFALLLSRCLIVLLASVRILAEFSNLSLSCSWGVYASAVLGISATVFLTLPKKKSSSILSQKMALDMANRMQVVWNTSTLHRGCDKQNTAYYVLARLWKGAVPMARPQSGSKLSRDYTSAIWCNKG